MVLGLFYACLGGDWHYIFQARGPHVVSGYGRAETYDKLQGMVCRQFSTFLQDESWKTINAVTLLVLAIAIQRFATSCFRY